MWFIGPHGYDPLKVMLTKFREERLVKYIDPRHIFKGQETIKRRAFANTGLDRITMESYSLKRQGVNGMQLYHIIKASKWPVILSLILFSLAVGFIAWASYNTGGYNLIFALVAFLNIFYFWCFDLMNESGEHNETVVKGIKIGMILFIISEFMFFFAFFWAYLHSSLNPSIFTGHVWPPVGQQELLIASINLPFLNTLLLLTSGLSVTLGHKFSSVLFIVEESIINLRFYKMFSLFTNPDIIFMIGMDFFMTLMFSINYIRNSLRLGLTVALGLTIFLAIIFTNIQYGEYVEANFNIADGIYASCFYLMTGFHGIHVIIGAVFLGACLIQLKQGQKFYKEVTGLECAIWYWHFVDVVWLFLYIIVYLIADNAYQRESKETLKEYLLKLERIFNNFAYGCSFEVKASGFAVKNQKYFMSPANTTMSEIIWLHDYIMFFIIVIFGVVLAILYGILHDYTLFFLYDRYMKFAGYRKKIAGHLYRSTKGKGFSKKRQIKNEQAAYRKKCY